MPHRAPHRLLALAFALACGPPPPAPTPPPEPTPAGPRSEPLEPAEPPSRPPAGPAEPAAEPTSEPTLEPAEPPDQEATRPGIPVVRRDEVTVGPKWSPDIIRRVFRRADLSRCKAGGAPPPATYRFTIDPAGAVTSAEALDADGQPSSDPAHACALEVLRALRFPSGMGPVLVSYPLR